jgi:molecular chaperone DnaK
MTVVAHGAALYASTLEKTGSAAAAVAASAKQAAAPADAGRRNVAHIELAYERASGSAQSPVGGVVDPQGGVHEVKIDGAGGYWTSGWVPVVDGCFQVDVLLHEARPVSLFKITARDARGNPVHVDPAEFTITYMLPMAAAPLPHTIAIELSTAHGVTTFDPVFQRHCPLPAEVRKTYRADRTLRPSELEGTLPIKFWEIDVSDDPQEKWWAGCVHVRADRIKRPIVEGSELELTVKIDASRKLTVELFIPLLNQSFSNEVYVPAPPSARSQLQEQVDLCFERLDHIREEMYAADRDDISERLDELQAEAEDIAEEVGAETGPGDDPDAALGPTAALRRLRIRLTQLEEQLRINPAQTSIARKLRWAVPYVERIVFRHGSDSAKGEFERLRGQYERYAEAHDARGLKWVNGQLWILHGTVVEDEMWHWEAEFAECKEPGRRYLNEEQAAQFKAEGDDALARKDMPALRSACRKLWKVLAPGQLETAAEKAAQSGLRS